VPFSGLMRFIASSCAGLSRSPGDARQPIAPQLNKIRPLLNLAAPWTTATSAVVTIGGTQGHPVQRQRLTPQARQSRGLERMPAMLNRTAVEQVRP
ncbi:MAG: hypothetical protein RIB84_12240, partial [Sneathiellaceae bacterium]